LFDKTTTVQLV